MVIPPSGAVCPAIVIFDRLTTLKELVSLITPLISNTMVLLFLDKASLSEPTPPSFKFVT